MKSIATYKNLFLVYFKDANLSRNGQLLNGLIPTGSSLLVEDLMVDCLNAVYNILNSPSTLVAMKEFTSAFDLNSVENPDVNNSEQVDLNLLQSSLEKMNIKVAIFTDFLQEIACHYYNNNKESYSAKIKCPVESSTINLSVLAKEIAWNLSLKAPQQRKKFSSLLVFSSAQ